MKHLIVLAVSFAAFAAEPNWPTVDKHAIEFLQTYVRIPSVSPPSNTLPCAQLFAAELEKLQDNVKPLTEAEVVRVMEQELRVPWEDVFASVDSEPLAAGTIGQVHRATLDDGSHVVIKVQRPRA